MPDRLGIPGLTATLAAVASIRGSAFMPQTSGSSWPACDGLIGPWDAIGLDVDNGPDFLIHD